MKISRKMRKRQVRHLQARVQGLIKSETQLAGMHRTLLARLRKAWTRLSKMADQLAQVTRERDSFAQLADARGTVISRLRRKYTRRTVEVIQWRAEAAALRAQLDEVNEDA